MKKVKVSAPGKSYLFGEHGVMYGIPSIVTAINRRMYVEAEKKSEGCIEIYAPDVSPDVYRKSISDLFEEQNPPKEFKFVVSAIKHFFNEYEIREGLSIRIESRFEDAVSLGTSAAVTEGTLGALKELFNISMNDRELFDLGYESHTLDVNKGKGSGFDIAAAIYGGTLKFRKGGDLIQPLKSGSLELLYAYLPELNVDTPTMVKRIEEKVGRDPERYKVIWNHMEKIVKQADNLLSGGDIEKLGELMYENHYLLAGLGVSTKQANTLVEVARDAGAYGAKMCGGVGDNVLILTSNKNREKVRKALRKTNIEEEIKIIDLRSNEEGLRVEK